METEFPSTAGGANFAGVISETTNKALPAQPESFLLAIFAEGFIVFPASGAGPWQNQVQNPGAERVDIVFPAGFHCGIIKSDARIMSNGAKGVIRKIRFEKSIRSFK